MSIVVDPESKYPLFIVVFSGDPIDLMEYRHTLLYLAGYDATTEESSSPPLYKPDVGSKELLQPENSSAYGTVYQVSGAHGFFTYEKTSTSEEEFSLTPGLLRQISVSSLTLHQAGELDHVCEVTPVNNRERGWNCQSWIGDVLQRAVEGGVLRKHDVDGAVEALADCLLEESGP